MALHPSVKIRRVRDNDELESAMPDVMMQVYEEFSETAKNHHLTGPFGRYVAFLRETSELENKAPANSKLGYLKEVLTVAEDALDELVFELLRRANGEDRTRQIDTLYDVKLRNCMRLMDHIIRTSLDGNSIDIHKLREMDHAEPIRDKLYAIKYPEDGPFTLDDGDAGKKAHSAVKYQLLGQLESTATEALLDSRFLTLRGRQRAMA